MHHFSTATVAKWRWHILWHITLIAINNVVVLVVFHPLAYFLFCPFCLIFVCRTANFLIYAIQGRFSKFYTNFVVQTFLTVHNHSPFGDSSSLHFNNRQKTYLFSDCKQRMVFDFVNTKTVIYFFKLFQPFFAFNIYSVQRFKIGIVVSV